MPAPCCTCTPRRRISLTSTRSWREYPTPGEPRYSIGGGGGVKGPDTFPGGHLTAAGLSHELSVAGIAPSPMRPGSCPCNPSCSRGWGSPTLAAGDPPGPRDSAQPLSPPQAVAGVQQALPEP